MTTTEAVIATKLLPKDSEFSRLNRRKIWSGWSFLVSGEWSQSPYHYGKHSFDYSISTNENYMRILHNGFPRTILIIGLRLHNETLPQLANRLLDEVKSEYGYYIDLTHNVGDLAIDF